MGPMARVLLAILLFSTMMMAVVPSQSISAEEVRITGHRLTVDYAGIMHITGVIENSGDTPVDSLRVTAHLFDSNGDRLSTYVANVVLDTAMPGYIVPFDIPISDRNKGKELATYDLSLEWKPATPKLEKLRFQDTNTFIWSHIDPYTKQYRNPHGDICMGACYFTGHGHGINAHSETDTLIFNVAEEQTTSIKVVAVWYDERGEFYSFDQQYLANNLLPGEAKRFVTMTHPAMGYYSLLVESDDYVGILRNDEGETMLRVYDANKDNQMLPGVDTIDMAEIIVSHEQERIAKIPLKSRPVIPHYNPHSYEITQTIRDSGVEYPVRIKTYSDNLIDFSYTASMETIKLTVKKAGERTQEPIHVEVILPVAFEKFSSADRFRATFEGVPLDGIIFSVDPYSYTDEVAFNYMISNNNIVDLWRMISEDYVSSEGFEFTLSPLEKDDAIPAVRSGKEVEFSSSLTNEIGNRQNFVYVMEVQGPRGDTILSWIEGEILPKDSVDTTFTWTPYKEGTYFIRFYVLESLDYRGPMSSSIAETTVQVTE